MSKVIISNAATGETIERDMTADELSQREAAYAQFLSEQQAEAHVREAQEAAKQSAISKLAALGLTVDEISAAFGLGN